MTEFITLSCPSCGGRLEVTEDIEQFACAHCGTEHRVRRSANTVSLTPLVEGIKNVQTGVDKTASELAIKRLKGEIKSLEKEFVHSYATRKRLASMMLIWGVICFGGILLAVYGDISGVVIGLLISGYCVYQIYRNYTKRSDISTKMENDLGKARKKSRQLKKHQKMVE
jgi:predicted RNA-binding Zn-ribbon protein involved in translation (DUF1610 family)